MPRWLIYVLLVVAGWLLIFKGKLPSMPAALQPPSPQHAPPAPPSPQTALIQQGGQVIGHLIDGLFRWTDSGTLPSGVPTASASGPEQLGYDTSQPITF